ncbi:MAG: peptidyl-prolyl cis-trans isomerase [Epsilonproteobacteria bacterium]|nr:MAG: peptidyl-prolyl cis-trans isomerase [Campylobacterota bacterium]
MFKLIFLLLISLTLMANTINGIAILVKDEPITLYDIESEMQKKQKPLKEVTAFLIRQKLEEIEVKERHLNISSQEVYAEIEKLADQNKMTVMQLYEAVLNAQKMSEKEFKSAIKKKLLNQKLFNAIAFSHMEEPSEDEEEEYYRLHPEMFTHPESFSVRIYSATSQKRLQEKVDNPMFYAPDVKSEQATLKYATINPRLAELLIKTKVNSFSPLLPGPNNTYMSFYMEEKSDATTQPLEEVRTQISNVIMGEKREQVLGDYFDRLRLNADIKIIRMHEEKKKKVVQPSFESLMQRF